MFRSVSRWAGTGCVGCQPRVVSSSHTFSLASCSHLTGLASKAIPVKWFIVVRDQSRSQSGRSQGRGSRERIDLSRDIYTAGQMDSYQ
jgi:hypothetical protein